VVKKNKFVKKKKKKQTKNIEEGFGNLCQGGKKKKKKKTRCDNKATVVTCLWAHRLAKGNSVEPVSDKFARDVTHVIHKCTVYYAQTNVILTECTRI